MKTLFTTALFFFLTAFASAAVIHVQGIVVDSEGNPVAGAIVESDTPGNRKVTHENGNFQMVLSSVHRDPVLFARTDDFSLVGIGHFIKEGELVTIELVPAASIKGRLIHPQTGEPLANVSVPFSLFNGERIIYVPYMGNLRTDQDGRFTAKGFVPGKRYLSRTGNMISGGFHALEPGEFDAGEIRFVVGRSWNLMMDDFFKLYRHEESPTARFEKAMQQSKESQKPVLVLFIYATENVGFMKWAFGVANGIQGQKYLAGFEYVPIDVTSQEQAAELAEKLGTKLPEDNEFTIIVCDSNGKIITRRDSRNFNAPRFKPDGELYQEFDLALVLTFLKEFGK